MPSQMTLSLKLNGITNLVNSLRKLNLELRKLNRAFNSTANTISKAAQQMGVAVNSAKGKSANTSSGGGNRGGGGSSRSNQPASPFSDVLDFMLGQRRFAAKKIIKRNFFGQGMPPVGGPVQSGAPPIVAPPVGGNAGGILGVVGRIIPIILVILAAIQVLKVIGQVLKHVIHLTIEAFKYLISSIRSFAAFFWNSGAQRNSVGQLRGIASALNLNPSDVAGAASNQPGMGRTLINKLKILRSIKSDEAAAIFANQENLQQFLPIRDLSNKQFNRALNEQSGNDKDVRKASANFDYAVGRLKLGLEKLAVSFAPVIEWIAMLIEAWSVWINIMAKLVNFIMGPFKKMISWLDRLLHGTGSKLENAADKFDAAVDKFTNKTGTHGGGDRAHNPIPRSWTWNQHQKELINRSRDLGNFEY